VPDAAAAVVGELVKTGPFGLLLAALVIAIVAFATGFIVPAKDRDEWRSLAKSQADRLDRIGDILEDRLRRR
jgi:hypothetical protein